MNGRWLRGFVVMGPAMATTSVAASYSDCFFFQGEDGIRGADVTGVQTCALPISRNRGPALLSAAELTRVRASLVARLAEMHAAIDAGETGQPAAGASEAASLLASEPDLQAKIGRASCRERV